MEKSKTTAAPAVSLRKSINSAKHVYFETGTPEAKRNVLELILMLTNSRKNYVTLALCDDSGVNIEWEITKENREDVRALLDKMTGDKND